MVDAEHIIKLVEAGYTKEEIDKLVTGTYSARESEETNTSGDNATGAELPEDNIAENENTITKDELDPFRAEIDELKKTIKVLQAQNAKNDTFTPPAADNMIADLSKNF